MTERPQRPTELVNGWRKIAELVGRFPVLQAWSLIIDQTTATATPLAPTTSVGTVQTDSDSEFWILAHTLQGFDTAAANLGEGLHGAANPNVPEAWVAKSLYSEGRGAMRYSSEACRAGHLAGTGIRPYYPPVPWILHPSSSLSVNLQVFDAADVTTRSFHGFHGFKRPLTEPPIPVDVFLSPRIANVIRMYRERGELGRIEPFAFPMNFDTPTQRPGIPVETKTFTPVDSDFVLCDIMGSVTDPVLGTFFDPPDTTIRMAVEQGARRLDQRALHLSHVAGSGQFPMRLASPLVLPTGSDLTVYVSQNQAAGQNAALQALTWNTYLTFAGFRVWKKGEAGR